MAGPLDCIKLLADSECHDFVKCFMYEIILTVGGVQREFAGVACIKVNYAVGVCHDFGICFTHRSVSTFGVRRESVVGLELDRTMLIMCVMILEDVSCS